MKVYSSKGGLFILGGPGDLVSRLIMGITRVILWVMGVI